jgi:ribonuclease VapC
MMVIDSSAMIAAIAGEPEAAQFRQLICDTEGACMSAVNVLESRVVLQRRFGVPMVTEFDLLLREAEIAVDPFDGDQSRLAYEAYLRYGKGGGHRAGLNLGDCAAYALARSQDLPLLYKGDDFSRTDIAAAL